MLVVTKEKSFWLVPRFPSDWLDWWDETEERGEKKKEGGEKQKKKKGRVKIATKGDLQAMQSAAAAIITDEQNIKQLGLNFSIPVTEWRQAEQNKTQCDAFYIVSQSHLTTVVLITSPELASVLDRKGLEPNPEPRTN